MADASDCFQQTWLSLYQNKHKITDPTRISAWLTTTAKREAIRLSKQARSNPGEAESGEQVDKSMLPDEEMEDLERQALLRNAISHLEDRCRKLINLMFFSPDDVSYETIAKKLNIAFNSLGPIRRRCSCLLRLSQFDGK